MAVYCDVTLSDNLVAGLPESKVQTMNADN